jgi:hypothetical protein
MTEAGRGSGTIEGAVWESDLDLVIVMDALTDGPLTRLLFAAVGAEPPGAVRVVRSATRTTDGRETDVLIDADAGVLLVENKLDADFQPDQPLSYQREVARLRAAGHRAWSVLVRPRRSSSRLDSTGAGFDAVVDLEEVLAVLEARTDRLDTAAKAVVQKAIQQRPRRPDDFDETRSAWGDVYRALVSELIPDAPFAIGPDSLRRRDTGEAWYVGPAIRQVGYLGHRIELGAVEATVYHHDVDVSSLPENASALTARTVQLKVPPMTFSRPPDDQHAEMRAVLAAVQILWAWLLRRRDA